MLVTVTRRDGTSYETEVDSEDLDDFLEDLESKGLDFELEEEDSGRLGSKLSVKMDMKSNSAITSAHMGMSAKIKCVKPPKRRPKHTEEDYFVEPEDAL